MNKYYINFFEKMKLKENVVSGIICIDGVVGVGKSSLANIISKKYNIPIYEEPVADNPILDKFYYDKKRWSFPLQVFFLNKRFQMIKDATKLPVCIMDRSIYGDVIFARMLVHDNEMTQEEFDVYEQLLQNMLEHTTKPKLMIYLETSVDNAVLRIQKRGREYEQIVPRTYWEHLDSNYREYFKHYNLSDLLIINVDNIDYVNNIKDQEKVLSLIENKLKELKLI